LLEGTRPPQEIQDLLATLTPQLLDDESIQYAHPFTFSAWTVVKPDGSVPSGMAGASHWLWGEGIPREIPEWNGKRVIILGKAPFPKKFSPVRVFASLEAKVDIKNILPEQDVLKYLSDMGSTSSDIRDAAVLAYKKWRE